MQRPRSRILHLAIASLALACSGGTADHRGRGGAAGLSAEGSGGGASPSTGGTTAVARGGGSTATALGGANGGWTAGTGGVADAGAGGTALGSGGGAGGMTGTGGATQGSGAGGVVVDGGTRAGSGGALGIDAGGGGSLVPCPGAKQTLTVGSGQQFATVQAAVNSVASSNASWVQINVKAGTYKEQVTINRPFVCLVGDAPTTTTISYTVDNNIVTGGTVLVKANDFAATNIAFENTHGPGEAGGQNQAVALMAQGQRQQFRNCRFLGYQDTLYTNTGTQYFRDCFIQGSVDYIFGDATAVFEDCTMNNVAEGTAVSAPRTPQSAAFGFVFVGGSLTAASAVRNGRVYLGRPWGPYAAAAFLNVKMGAHIAADGWTTMSGNTLAETHFWEYKSSGAGANPTNATRASRQLGDSQVASYTVTKVLSPWVPEYSR